MDAPPSLYDFTRPELAAFLASLGAPRYRADQLWRWLYGHLVTDMEAMTNVPADLRRRLAAETVRSTLRQVAATDSEDGMAVKYLWRLIDGELIETVLMHYVDSADEDAPADAIPRGRHTVCLSTQAGCAMGCVFCATGQMGLVRNLTLGECVEQLVQCARQLKSARERLTNVVFMGMGEPLANWPATWRTVEVLTDPLGFALSPRRLTISTVGIVPGILRLADQDKAVRLAVSIHAPTDALRNQLVPINSTYPLADIMAACRAYQDRTGRRITFEYVLIRDVNDRPDEAKALAKLLAGRGAHVNLIPLNPTAGSPMRPSRYDTAVAFAAILQRAGIATTLRMRRGIEIQAGCGQLRSRAAMGLVGRTIGFNENRPIGVHL